MKIIHKFGHFRTNCLFFALGLLRDKRSCGLLIRIQHGAPHFMVQLRSGYIIHLTRRDDEKKIRVFPGQIFNGQGQIFTPNCLRPQKYWTWTFK